MSEGGRGKKEAGRSLQPPDGGWGWMVVFGSALANIFLIPIMQNFTLIFKDEFLQLGFTSTNITTLVSLNASFGMLLGLVNGPILKIFGFRKVALLGLTLYVVGILCTGIASNYIEFIIFYGLLTSLGLVLVMGSFSLAINTYFVKNRSKAVGYTMTLTGLGPIIMPFVISFLLASYGLKWTIFLLSGLCLHGFIGAFLLQPVKRHMKLQNSDASPEEKQSTMLLSDVHSILEMPVWGSKMSLPGDSLGYAHKNLRLNSVDLSGANKKLVVEEPQENRKLSLTFLDNEDYKNMMSSTLHMIDRMEILEKSPKCASAETLNLENEKSPMEPLQPIPEKNLPETESENVENGKCRGLVSRAVHFLKDLYDLDLFHDLSYINIILGLSLAFSGEIIFSTMTPIILREVGFNTEESAIFMSIIAGFDLLFRFIAPFVGRRLKLDSRKMYLSALTMLLICRASMYLAKSYEMYLLVSIGLGIGKGFRSIFWVLVLPDYVPISKLPSASAFQNLLNGIVLLASGPVIGAITALSQNYFCIIIASNVLTLATIVLWCGEIIYFKYKKKYLL